jgi:predicted nucleotidyltransferase
MCQKQDILTTLDSLDKPKFINSTNLKYLVFGGSISYELNVPSSDTDIVGVVMPPIEYVYQKDVIYGYEEPKVFSHYKGKSEETQTEFTIYSLPRFFRLCADGNPNVLENLFCDEKFILINSRLRAIRYKFLSKQVLPKYIGFATSTIHQLEAAIKRFKNGELDKSLTRYNLYEKYGFDTKCMSHAIRLLLGCIEILKNHTYVTNLQHEYVKSIKQGEIPYEECKKIMDELLRQIRCLEVTSTLRANVDNVDLRRELAQLIKEFSGF